MANEADEEVIGTLVTLMALEYAPYLLALERVHHAVTRIATQIEARYESMGESAKTLATSFYAISIATAAVAAIVTYAWHTVAEEVMNAAEAAERLGTTTEDVRMWGVAATLAGKSVEQFSGSIESLHKRIQEMSTMPVGGIAELMSGSNRAFTMLGLSVWQLRNMGSGEQLSIIAERLSQVKDKALQLQLAQELLGDSGAYMLKYLKNGAAGVEELRQRMNSFHLTLSEGQSGALEASIMSYREMKLALQGFLTQVSAAAAPLITLLSSVARITLQILGWAASLPYLGKLLVNTTGFVLALTVAAIALGGAILFVETALMPLLDIGMPLLATALGAALGAIIGVAGALFTTLPGAVITACTFLLYMTGIVNNLTQAITTMSGALIGFMLGGPIGGLIGGIAGLLLGKYLTSGSSTKSNTVNSPQMIASSSMASIETNQILSKIYATNQSQAISAENMIALLKQAAPPHMAYSW